MTVRPGVKNLELVSGGNNPMAYFSAKSKGSIWATIQSPRGGVGAGVFVVVKLFISTRLGGALKIVNFITC